ncbi:hypothetical protein [Priestia megaterium]|uniref:hypothetical protein n=1 Tax=Priestia megaterium TaxID=1404 RepID=UPI0039F6CAE0
METNFRSFLKTEGINAELNLYAQGNSTAEITAAGLNLVKVKQLLMKNTWWYETSNS